ncbi:MAG: sensor domain-containing diguanylate cyclase [Cellvibrionaceae bacterium]
MEKRLFYTPLIGLTLLSIGGFLAFSMLLTNWLNDYSSKSLQSDLDRINRGLQQHAPENTPEFLSDYLKQQRLIYPQRAITLIRNSGEVIADSERSVLDLVELDKVSDLPEIATALSTGSGYSIRFNSALNTNVMYAARQTKFGDFSGLLRVSTPLLVSRAIASDLKTMVGSLLIAIIVCMALLARNVIRGVDQHLHTEQEQLEKHVEDRTREIELLQRLANMLAACNSLSEAQQVVQDVIPRMLGDINGAVSMMRASRNQLEVKLDWGGSWPGATAFAPDECWALRKGKFHLANDKFTTLPCSHMRNVGNDQTLCIPLIAHGNTIGMMHLYMHDQEVSEERFQLAFTICEQLGLALANLTLQEELREQAVRDTLTGLHNRRFLEESIDHELMRAQRHNQSLSLLMLDMDHFKRFNDNFGHDAGDYVLKALSSLLVNGVRGEDMVCRVGGEELCVVVPNTSGEAAMAVADKLCNQVRDLHLDFHGQSLGKLTLSIGVATYPQDAEDYASLMKLADVALYEAKENGRDHPRHCNSGVMINYSTQIDESARIEPSNKLTTTTEGDTLECNTLKCESSVEKINVEAG